MSDPVAIRVNFTRPFPVFPLNQTVLMPHGILPLNIFEPRYRQMASDALDGAGQIAMAIFHGTLWQQQYHARPPIRPYLCLGQIVQHHKLDDGRFALILQGICRARVVSELPPDETTLYRRALLEPVGLSEPDDARQEEIRAHLQDALRHEPLNHLLRAEQLVQHLADPSVPTNAILELISLTLLNDPEKRYQLLATVDPEDRARILTDELNGLGRLLRQAQPQRRAASQAPKGCHWN